MIQNLLSYHLAHLCNIAINVQIFLNNYHYIFIKLYIGITISKSLALFISVLFISLLQSITGAQFLSITILSISSACLVAASFPAPVIVIVRLTSTLNILIQCTPKIIIFMGPHHNQETFYIFLLYNFIQSAIQTKKMADVMEEKLNPLVGVYRRINSKPKLFQSINSCETRKINSNDIRVLFLLNFQKSRKSALNQVT